MTKEVREKLLELLQQISYAHDEGWFWKAWGEMQKYIWDYKVEEDKEK